MPKEKNKEDSDDANIKKRQLTARDQCVGLIRKNLQKSVNNFLRNSNFLAEASKDGLPGKISGVT